MRLASLKNIILGSPGTTTANRPLTFSHDKTSPHVVVELGPAGEVVDADRLAGFEQLRRIRV